MTFAAHANGSPDDAQLVRYLHGELDADDVTAMVRHLDACADCRDRADQLRDRMHRLGDALRAADFDPPPAGEWADVLDTDRVRGASRRRAATFRIAAGWVMIAGAAVALLAPPVRAWIAERVATFTTTPDAHLTAPAADSDAAAIAFEPVGPELIIDVAAHQAAGTLAIRFGTGTAAHVTVRGEGDERLTVGTRTLRIDNHAASQASYDIVLPASIERATVHVAGAAPLIAERADGAATIALGDGSVRTPGARDEDWQ